LPLPEFGILLVIAEWVLNGWTSRPEATEDGMQAALRRHSKERGLPVKKQSIHMSHGMRVQIDFGLREGY